MVDLGILIVFLLLIACCLYLLCFNSCFFPQQLRESIAEHKPHIDKILKIGPQLKELNPEEGKMVEEKYQKAENMYAQIKDEVRQRALALDEAVSQSAQVCMFVLEFSTAH